MSLIPSPLWRFAVVVLASFGLLVAGYLYYTSFTATGPLGCGEDSGCGAVLGSRWASVLGVPVSLPAALTYLAIIAGVIALPKVNPDSHPTIWVLLLTLAVAIVWAAGWFVGLQMFYLGEICPWCMTEHVIGLCCAGLILVAAWMQTASRQELKIRFPRKKFDSAVLFGTLAVTMMVATQFLQEHSGPLAERMEMGGSLAGEGDSRTVSVLNDRYEIKLAEYPSLGSIEAEGIVIVLFDYCCPHCRSTHGYLKNALENHAGKLGVVMLPMPLNSNCNPHWKKNERRFAEACELAKLALSVWKVAPEHFETFDEWLFASPTPRTFENAVAYSNTFLNDEQITALSRSDIQLWADSIILHDVNLYVDSQAERIPVLISPNFDAVVGRPGSEEELMKILEGVIK